MVRAGILSMQRIFNYGSFLQAYALKKILEDLGCEVEFVDYHPGRCLVPEREDRGIPRKIQKARKVFRLDAPIREKLRFIKYKKNYGKKYYPLLGISEKERNYAPEVDLLVIGSDEVFNCVQENANVGFSPELFGEGNNAGKLISYAASFGNTTMEKLEQYQVKNQVAEFLNRFDAVSVRDHNSEMIVEKLIGNAPETHLDPVLIWQWDKSVMEKHHAGRKYLVLYGYSGRFSKEECSAVKKFAEKKKLDIVALGGIQSIHAPFVDCSPLEVISYFAGADYVITDTFHGVVLSVITHKKFAVFIRSRGYGNSEKIGDLCEKLHLMERIIDNIKDMGTAIEKEIDYPGIEQLLKRYRKETYWYLRQSLE